MNTARTSVDVSLRFRTLLVATFFGIMLTTPVQSNVDIADIPLFLTASVDPNIMFVIDDSGSMHFELMPDGLILYDARYVFPRSDNVYNPSDSDYQNRVPTVDDNNPYNALSRSSKVNTLYYDPGITYTPWSKSDGTLWPNAVLGAAYHNPAKTSAGSRDLTSDNTQSARWYSCSSPSSCSSTTTSKTFWPATYFWHNGGDIWTWGNYTRTEIRSSTGTYTGEGRKNRTDCAAASTATCTYDEEIQNFANWYSYYRSRILAARAGIGKAFSQQGESLRVGYGAINKGSSDIDNVSTGTIVRGVRPFGGTSREDFFDLLYERDIPAAGTPLRRALDDAGQYFSRSDDRGPWGAVPGTSDSTAHLQCRQSYTILMTDGYWSGGSSYEADTSGARANVDNSTGPTITGPNSASYQYTAADPYRDSHSNILADVAMYYWNRDLRTDLDNEVPTTPLNEAFWQHMVTFGVGLGVTGTIKPKDAWKAQEDGTAINWPDPDSSSANCSGASCPARIDDLLHAAVNSRGGFFSAADPVTFSKEMGDLLSTIVARVDASSTSAAASSATLQTDTLLYTAGFRAKDWSGQLIARQVLINGTVSTGAPEWNAEEKLVTQAGDGSRKIFTSVRSAINAGTHVLSGNGVKLDHAALTSLDTNQENALNSDTTGATDSLAANRIQWLYGDESAHASFRSRQGVDSQNNPITRLLGDVIGSNPQFAGKQNFGYRILTGLTPNYLDFRTSSAYQNRPNMLYVGANDGMLHAFDATTGLEQFAYMPSELLLPEIGDNHARINHLMDADYDHRYYVDGTATVWDAHWSGSWKTVLVGTMGAGGRTVYALDVTFPQSFDQTKVLWEFTDPDLGYGVDKPTIVRMQNGDWAAVFGNGYNSANHKAVLFIVRLSDGHLLAKIDTNETSDTAASPNGLSTPTVTLSLDNLSANIIYAGDLKGRLWRFDVSSTSPNEWDNQSNRTVLFEAEDSYGNPQPITAAPEVALKPGDPNILVVLFGTGSYFRDQDSGSSQIQSLYGIFDDNGTAVSRGDLLVQEITWEGDETFNGQVFTLREVSDTDVTSEDGWVLDLSVQGQSATGERVISKPVLLTGTPRDRVRFSTLIPNPDPCGTGGGRDGFVMDLLIGAGGAASYPVFDLNNDGSFDAGDQKGRNYSGLNFGGGEQLVVIQTGDGLAKLYTGVGEDISALEPQPPPGRQSWRQLR